MRDTGQRKSSKNTRVLLAVLAAAACFTGTGCGEGRQAIKKEAGQEAEKEAGREAARESGERAPEDKETGEEESPDFWEERDVLRQRAGMDLEGDYRITETMEGSEEDYIRLSAEGNTYYIRRPAARTEEDYIQSEGAFWFEIPHDWVWGTCELDERLEELWESLGGWNEEGDYVPCLLWGVEDNDMGANVFSHAWEETCGHMKETAETVFGDRLLDIRSEKYTLEDGNDVYGIRCTFDSGEGKTWMVSAAYRFGEKYMMEFIGLNYAEDTLDMGNVALYTAATYEEYGGERYRPYEGAGRYKGMDIWNYKRLHNPFVLAYEKANREVWRQAPAQQTEEDSAIEWEETLLEELVREALQIGEREISSSDLLLIDTLVLMEEIGTDWCIINETEIETDFSALGTGDGLVRDLKNFKNLQVLKLQIGSISDYSPLGELGSLEELDIRAGRTVKDISFLEKLPGLLRLTMKKAPVQIFVDSLSAELWKRTCREQGISTFAKEYDGEPGLAFDQVEVPEL